MPGDINVCGVLLPCFGAAPWVLGLPWGMEALVVGCVARCLPSLFAACLVIAFINSVACRGAFSVPAYGKTKIDAEVSPVSTRKCYCSSGS